MSFTFPITPPSGPAPAEFTWRHQSAAFMQISEFALQEKLYSWSGQRRRFTAKFQKLSYEQAKKWQGFILSLSGREGTFLYQDPMAFRIRGSVGNAYLGGQLSGSPTGTRLDSQGWPASRPSLLVKGDWISISGQLYQIQSTVSSDGSGAAQLHVWPRLRWNHEANAAVFVGSTAYGQFRLTDFPKFAMNVEHMMEGFSIAAEEAVYTPDVLPQTPGIMLSLDTTYNPDTWLDVIVANMSVGDGLTLYPQTLPDPYHSRIEIRKRIGDDLSDVCGWFPLSRLPRRFPIDDNTADYVFLAVCGGADTVVIPTLATPSGFNWDSYTEVAPAWNPWFYEWNLMMKKIGNEPVSRCTFFRGFADGGDHNDMADVYRIWSGFHVYRFANTPDGCALSLQPYWMMPYWSVPKDG